MSFPFEMKIFEFVYCLRRSANLHNTNAAHAAIYPYIHIIARNIIFTKCNYLHWIHSQEEQYLYLRYGNFYAFHLNKYFCLHQIELSMTFSFPRSIVPGNLQSLPSSTVNWIAYIVNSISPAVDYVSLYTTNRLKDEVFAVRFQ